jgi:DNA gyrase subunit A
MTTPDNETVIDRELTELFRTKYATFASSANARAIPDARDGAKPIHRRLLYTAKQYAPSSRATVKSASIVGQCLAGYHPHGDASVYDAMTRMTRDFSNNVPLIYGHGNMGAIDGSGAAAARYTEAKLEASADWLVLDGVDEGAVPHAPNYDGRLTEPELLPVKMPMLLLNGVPGGSIGVGFASQIPPHNAAELAKASKYVLQCMATGIEPELSMLMTIMPGPDFPTGGLVGSASDIAEAYRTGQGSLKMRSEITVEESDSGRTGDRIIITAIPFGLTTEGIVNDIAEAASGKRDPKTKARAEPSVPEVKEVRDETTKDRKTKQVKVRIVVDLKQGEDSRVVLEKLLRSTRLETTFPVNMTALNEDGLPITLGVIEAIVRWANFRAECVRRQSAAELERVRDREHVVKGLLAAIPKIDAVVKTIKNAADEETANRQLRTLIPCTSKQADAILAMQLRRLTGLRHDELASEAATLAARADHLLTLLTDQAAIIGQMEDELSDVVKRFGRPRRTTVANLAINADPRALVVEEDCLISVTGRGYLKRLPADEFRVQNRNTKGKMGAKVKADDVLQSVVGCTSHDRIFAVTDGGGVVRLEAHEIPVTSGSGRHAANLGFEEGELVKGLLVSEYPVPEAAQSVFATVDGEVKRVVMADLDSKMTKRLVFFKSSAGRGIAGAIQLPSEDGTVFLASAHGYGTRFLPSEVRLSKRDSGGVRGMDLRSDDQVVSIGRIDNDEQLLLCVSSDGVGKRVSCSQFPIKGRGIKGNILIKPRPGAVLIQALVVTDADSVLIATKNGHTVRIRVGDVKELGRSAMGVKLVALNEGDRVVSAALLPFEE